MDVSYDCELNLSTNFERTSFKEAASYDEWKETMQKEYDAHKEWNLEADRPSIWNQNNRQQVGFQEQI